MGCLKRFGGRGFEPTIGLKNTGRLPEDVIVPTIGGGALKNTRMAQT